MEANMDTKQMLCTAFALFALAAVGGLVMAAIRFGGNRNPPAWLAFGHGLLAAAGLTLLVYPALTVGVSALAGWAALLLAAAAAGGAVLNLAYHWRQLPIPAGLTIGHILLAVTGFVLLGLDCLKGYA
jgi:hypothetical protein